MSPIRFRAWSSIPPAISTAQATGPTALLTRAWFSNSLPPPASGPPLLCTALPEKTEAHLTVASSSTPPETSQAQPPAVASPPTASAAAAPSSRSRPQPRDGPKPFFTPSPAPATAQTLCQGQL